MRANSIFKKENIAFEGEVNGANLKLSDMQVRILMNNENPNVLERAQIQYLAKFFAINGPQKYVVGMLTNYFMSNYDWNHPVLGDLNQIIDYINNNWDEEDKGLNLVKIYLEDLKYPGQDPQYL